MAAVSPPTDCPRAAHATVASTKTESPTFRRVRARVSGSQQQEFIQLPSPHVLPATKNPKEYVAMHPGTSMLLTHATAFLDNIFQPHQKRSKGGGKNGQLMFCCHRPSCTMLCRLVPVPNSDPPLYKAEVKRCCREHTNHDALEDEQAQQSALVPVLGPNGKFKGLPLSDKIKLYIDQLDEVNPKATPDMIMVHLVAHPLFANRLFLMDACRADITRKVRYYRSNASRAKHK